MKYDWKNIPRISLVHTLVIMVSTSNCFLLWYVVFVTMPNMHHHLFTLLLKANYIMMIMMYAWLADYIVSWIIFFWKQRKENKIDKKRSIAMVERNEWRIK